MVHILHKAGAKDMGFEGRTRMKAGDGYSIFLFYAPFSKGGLLFKKERNLTI